MSPISADVRPPPRAALSRRRSQLAPKLTLLDARGRTVLGQAQAAGGEGNTVAVRIDRATAGGTYLLRVEGATRDVFGIGSYGVAAVFEGRNSVSPAAIDAVLRGAYDGLNSDDLDDLLRGPDVVLFNDDRHTDDVPIAATRLAATPGFAQDVRYRAVGSLSAGDVDYFRFNAARPPKGKDNVLTATVRAVTPNSVAPRIVLLDRDYNPVAAQVLANGDGTFTIQAGGMKGGANYYVRVEPGDASGASVGNFALDIEFGTATAVLETFAQGTVGIATSDDSYDFYVARSQLFQFLLSAQAVGAPAAGRLAVTIADANGRVVYRREGRLGDVVSGPALFLTPGAYTLRVAASSPAGLVAPASYRLFGQSISDPIGPALQDTTLAPVYLTPAVPPVYTYPGNVTSPRPYLIVSRPRR